MTTPYLLADLERDEGCRLEAYPDPLSGGAPWTVGYGHCGPEVHPGLTITQTQADAYLALDVSLVQRGLDSALPWWRRLDDVRQDVFCNAAFNLGVHGLLGFRRFLAAAQDYDYPTAAAELLHSQAARQLPARYARLSRQMLTGERQAVAA